MPEADETPREGVLHSIRELLDSLFVAFQTRLSLLAADIEGERNHLLTQWTLVLGVVYCFGVSLIFGAMIVVLAFWDSYRLQALSGLAALFFACGLVATACLVRRMHRKPGVFEMTLAELDKDRAQLKP